MSLDPITADVVLLVEGKDDRQIVCHLLDGINPDWKQCVDVQAKGGVNGLEPAVRAIAVVSGFDRVKKVAVLVDADERPEKTDETWAEEKRLFLAAHPDREMHYLVLPSSTDKGALETVFLRSLELENTNAQCVVKFMSCISGNTLHTTQAQKDKLELITYINTHVKTPFSRVGFAMANDAKNLFDFNHPAFQPLVVFLKSLF
jgi:hypothetical protein